MLYNEIPQSPEKKQALTKVEDISQFIMGDKLGKGAFGVVKQATHILTGERVAIKVLEFPKIKTAADRERIDREIAVLKSLRHYSIIQLYSVITTKNSLYLVQEFANGKQLLEYILSKIRLEEKEACHYFQQIISGVEYFHKMKVAHRDLKPENMLLTASRDIKIVDFGLCNTYYDGELLSTACGSPCFAAPEMLSGKRYKGSNVDIWSCGVILYLMLCGVLPFEDSNNQSLYKKIIDGKYTLPSFISKEAKNLLMKIMETNPRKRITFKQIKNHPWFNLIDWHNNVHSGIDPKVIVFPIDEEIINKMETYEYNKKEVRKNILSNEHNNITTTYYLLLKQKIRNKQTSVSDLKSKEYDDYINNKDNLMSNYKNDIKVVIRKRANNPLKVKKEDNIIKGESKQEENNKKEEIYKRMEIHKEYFKRKKIKTKSADVRQVNINYSISIKKPISNSQKNIKISNDNSNKEIQNIKLNLVFNRTNTKNEKKIEPKILNDEINKIKKRNIKTIFKSNYFKQSFENLANKGTSTSFKNVTCKSSKDMLEKIILTAPNISPMKISNQSKVVKRVISAKAITLKTFQTDTYPIKPKLLIQSKDINKNFNKNIKDNLDTKPQNITKCSIETPFDLTCLFNISRSKMKEILINILTILKIKQIIDKVR